MESVLITLIIVSGIVLIARFTFAYLTYCHAVTADKEVIVYNPNHKQEDGKDEE